MLKPNSVQKLDAGVFHGISPLLFEDYRYLVPTTRAKLRQNFMSGKVKEPEFRYRRLNEFGFDEKRHKLDSLAEQVSALNYSIVNKAYYAKIEEIEQRLNMLEATHWGDDSAFARASVKLYGAPRADIYNYTLRMVKEKIELIKDNFTDSRIFATMSCLEDICADASEERYSWELSSLGKPRLTKNDGDILSSKKIVEMCLGALSALDIHDWHVTVSGAAGSTVFDTDHRHKTIFVPRDSDIASRKTPLTEPYAKALIEHEIGTHVARRVHGERSPLQLLSLGLDHYLRGEEGLATYAEDKVLGADDFAGEARYLAISLGYGVGDEPRSYRSVWEAMKSYFTVKSLSEALIQGRTADIDSVLAIAPTNAWLQCLRTFRGTTGATPGAVFTKDLVYREGSIAIWNVVAKNPDCQQYFHLGKYDPANRSHLEIMSELGLVDRSMFGELMGC